MDRYSHTLREQEVNALAKLPDISSRLEANTLKATGTEGGKVEFDYPPDCPEKGGIQRYSVDYNAQKLKTVEHWWVDKRPSKNSQQAGKNAILQVNSTEVSDKKQQAAGGFEPPNNGFANRRLRPLGYAASFENPLYPQSDGLATKI